MCHKNSLFIVSLNIFQPNLGYVADAIADYLFEGMIAGSLDKQKE